MNLAKLLIPFIVIVFTSCGKEDILPNLATGGLYGVAKLGYNAISDPCKIGVSKCDNNANIGKIRENNATEEIDPKDLNTTPSIIAYKTDVTLNVDEEFNILLRVDDRDGDDVNLSVFVEKPSVVSATISLNPYLVSIKALTPGSTFVKVFGKDDDKHIGESQNINVNVLGGNDNNATVIKEEFVEFTKDKIKMQTSSFERLGWTIKGLQSDYTIEVEMGNSLVEVNTSKSATTIDIYSNSKSGVTVAKFTFTDSTGSVIKKDLGITVTDTSVNPPVGGDKTNYTTKDTEACKYTNLWKRLKNSYSIGERSIDSFNSITFQSLSTATLTQDIEFFYRDTVLEIQDRPDDAMDIKVDEVPKEDGNLHTDRGFIIQASKGFFNSGYYYVKIDDDCYRGEFPKNDSVKQQDLYKRVKLVID